MTVNDAIDELRATVAASRVTVRLEQGGGALPVTHEALSPGVTSIKNEVLTPDMRHHPIVQKVLQGNQVVQDDCIAASSEPQFRELLERYGGMRAQILTPITCGTRVVGIVSVHVLKRTRLWSDQDALACWSYADRIARTVCEYDI
jgi:GAF domain-containing protein